MNTPTLNTSIQIDLAEADKNYRQDGAIKALTHILGEINKRKIGKTATYRTSTNEAGYIVKLLTRNSQIRN